MDHGKKGSVSVFLVLALASALLVAAVLVRAAGLAAGRSYGDAAFQMAGRSLLSEFDRRLFDDYGLFGMRTDEGEAARKLRRYGDASLNRGSERGRGAVWLIPCAVGEVGVDLKQYSLSDVNVFEKQILDDAKYAVAQNLKETLLPERGGAEGSSGGAEGEGRGAGGRSVQNQAVINGLPSKGLGGGGLPIGQMLARGLPTPEELLNGTADGILTTEYILSRFAAANTKIPKLAAGHDRFFRNEAEYVIAGKYDDGANYKDVTGKIKLLRFALNEVTIHTDRDMAARVDVAAEILMSIIPPGPWTPFIREMVAAVWCAIETENDMKLLEQGEKVALHKKSRNWATSPENVVAAILECFEAGMDPVISSVEDQAKYKAEGLSAIKPPESGGAVIRGLSARLPVLHA
ncbi:MAG: DUF5702 domain-containing protein [Clostridiales Family XIII bacterium]|jgi:hypothetical protein|nr:DUF5702 domain-containing protein [Clostridiales Family XIII bacterium]